MGGAKPVNAVCGLLTTQSQFEFGFYKLKIIIIQMSNTKVKWSSLYYK